MNLNTIQKNFKNTRINALANPYLYGLKYTQKNKKDAYIEYLEDILKFNLDLIQKRIDEMNHSTDIMKGAYND